MSHESYDVIIVGAGPAGSCLAYELASSGHDVAVFEEKGAPGLNACCTGIISTECFRSLDPGTEVILTGAKSARFFSPSGRCLRLDTEKDQAYVVDRLLLDKAMASKAQSRGARYFLASRVVDIIPGRDGILAEVVCSGAREVFSARAVVLANGLRPRLSRKLGLGTIKSFLVGAQTEVEVKDADEPEVYFGQGMAQGSFAWLVPASANRAYAGLLAGSGAKLQLQKFLDNLFRQGRISCRDAEIRQKPVPVGMAPRSYGDRILVVGDAAGQVKPTTGGGIYFGHLGARIAAQVLDQALDSDDLTAGRLSRYQKLWRARMGKELSRGYWARRAYARLSDRQIEGIFSILASGNMTETLLNSGRFSFDWHSWLILAVLRHTCAHPVRKIKHLLSCEAGS